MPPVPLLRTARMPGGSRGLTTSSLNSLSAIPTAFNNAGLQKEVFGFAPYWSLSQESTWDYSVVSTFAYFGLTVNWDGTWYTADGGWNGFNSANFTDMVNRAHQAGDRVLLVIKASGEQPLNDVVTVPTETQLVITNTIAQIAAKNLDGVNVDFEGYTYAGLPNLQSGMTNFVTQMSAQVHQRWPSAFVTVDTYTGSASWDGGLMKIDALAPVVDAMFIMAYDMSFDNSPGQAGPTAPMTGWTYNDTTAISQYLTKAPASKIILGVPWYGYRFTTNGSAAYASDSAATADSYSQDISDLNCGRPIQAWDSTAQSPWAAWYSLGSGDPCGLNKGSWQELYWDSVQSLGIKYDLVNQSGIRGMGVWALGYDGGAPELWSELSTYFSCPASLNLPASVSTTEFTVGLSAGTCSVASYDIAQYDSTLNQGWFGLKSVVASAGAGTAVVEGFPGHTYEFEARAHSTSGLVGSWTTASTTVATTATYSHPFKGVYTLDAYGGVNGDSSPPLGTSAYWPGWKIARVAKALPGAMPQTGAVLDGWGGLHSYGAPIGITTSAYWPGWDIARDFAFLPDGSGGYVLDGYGGLHPFALSGKPMPPAVSTGAYWPGWDIARKVAIFSDGTGGYVLDGWGGLHAFGIGGPRPAAPVLSGYWVSWDIIHDFSLIPGTHSGYVLDGFGGIHPFTATGQAMPPALSSGVFWWGWDIARSVLLLPGSTLAQPGGYVMDGYGGLHAFGNAPAPTQYPYWPYQDIARNITGY
jgi:spore germination protein YaaH